MNRDEIMAFHPRNFCAWDRVSWLRIVSIGRIVIHVVWDGFIQIGAARGSRMVKLESQRVSGFKGRKVEFIMGSKDEKMSENISFRAGRV